MRVSKLQSFAGGLMLLLAIITVSVYGESYDNGTSADTIKIVTPADKSQIDAGEEWMILADRESTTQRESTRCRR